MDTSDGTSKYCDREGGVGKSACPERKDRSKDYETQAWRQVEEIFEASSLRGGGDGITEMINGIAMSIKFDDVLDELRYIFAKASEHNGDCDTVNDPSPIFGSNLVPTKEVAEPTCAAEKNNNSQQTTDRLHGFSAETTEKSCINGGNKGSLQNTKRFRHVSADTNGRGKCNKELRAYLSEATQNTAEKQKLKLHKESVQDVYTDDKSSEKQITKVLEDVSKENINNSREELETALSEASEKAVKENSLKLREELAKGIYVDIFDELLGYITDSFHKAVLGYGRGVVKRLEVGFHKIVQKFGHDLVHELVNWHEDGLVEDIDELKVEVEEEIKIFTKDSELKLISVCEKEINEYGFYLGTVLSDCVKRVQVCERLTTIKDFDTSNEKYLDSDELQNKFNAVESNSEHGNTEERNDKYRNTEEKNDKYKKHPFKKMWHNIKKVFCFRGAESSSE